MLIIKYISILLLLIACSGFSQDTVFINKHYFPSLVKNVFLAKDEVHVKTVDGLYKLSGTKWKLLDSKFTKPFVFYNENFFEADYIPDPYVFTATKMARLIPQDASYFATKAQVNEKLFVAISGNLYEYQINKHYRRSYNKNSVRDIYFDKDLSVISTYSGIYLNDSLIPPQKGPNYSSGDFCKINDRYFLCSDDLFEFSPKTRTFSNLIPDINPSLGLFRKLVTEKGTVYSLNTRSINILENFKIAETLHSGFEYYDLEVINDGLAFCTSSGEVFYQKNKQTTLLANLKTRVRDIFHFGNKTFLASDNGVYTIDDLNPKKLEKIFDLPFVVSVCVDKHGNFWISTERGLFLKNTQEKSLITIIPEIEFNRGAFSIYNDKVYAGSIEGVFELDIIHIMRDYLPQYLYKKNIRDKQAERKQLIFLLSFIFILVLGFIYYYRYRKVVIPKSRKDATVLSLDEIKKDIIANNILTVEDLASFYKTNTVQLNRIFRTYETTPGRFLKQVKLNYASELKKMGVPMVEIAHKTGYSAQFLKQNMP